MKRKLVKTLAAGVVLLVFAAFLPFSAFAESPASSSSQAPAPSSSAPASSAPESVPLEDSTTGSAPIIQGSPEAPPPATPVVITFMVGEQLHAQVNYDETFALPADPAPPEGETGVFLGWFESPDASGTAIDFSTLELQQNVTVYAGFGAATSGDAEPNEDTLKHTVTFVAQGNANIVVNVARGQTCPPQAAPAIYPEGAVSFRGWFASLEDQEPFNFETVIQSNTTLYAKFSNTYLIKFKNAQGQVVDTKEVAPTDTVQETSIPIDPPQEGTFLDYWYIEGELETAAFAFGSHPTKDITLIPHFSNMHYVYFISQGSQVENNPVSVQHGAKVAEPGDPTRAGYKFLHWSTTEGGSEYKFNTPVTADMSLYAVWKGQKVGYKVVYWLEKPNFSGDPGTNRDNYSFAYSVTRPANHGATAGESISLSKSVANGLLDDDMPDALKYADFRHSDTVVLSGTGNTVVNVYYSRISYTITFDLDSNYSGTHMTANGTVYRGNGAEYTITAKYEQDIGDLWPHDVTYRNNNNDFAGWSAPNNVGGNTWLSKRYTLT